jgi:hypothetical protein
VQEASRRNVVRILRTIRLVLVVCFAIAALSCRDAAYRTATTANTVEAYRTYLAEHPNGAHAQDAAKAIETLQYEQASKANTVEAYATYLKENPQGAHRHEARTASFGLRATALAKKAKTYLDGFREANEKAPSGFALLMLVSELELLAPEATEIAPDMAKTVAGLYGALDAVWKENSAYLDKVKRQGAGFKDVERLRRVMQVDGSLYLKFWDQHRADVMQALDAFCAAVAKVPAASPQR